MAARIPSSRDLVRLARERGGHLQIMQRQKGVAYYYRYRDNGKTKVRIFKLGADTRQIESFILDVTRRNFIKHYRFAPGRTLKGDKMAMGNLFVWYETGLLKRKRKKLQYMHVYMKNKLLRFFADIGFAMDEPIVRFDREKVMAFHGWLAQKGMKPFSIKTILMHLMIVFRDAGRKGLISHFPFREN